MDPPPGELTTYLDQVIAESRKKISFVFQLDNAKFNASLDLTGSSASSSFQHSSTPKIVDSIKRKSDPLHEVSYNNSINSNKKVKKNNLTPKLTFNKNNPYFHLCSTIVDSPFNSPYTPNTIRNIDKQFTILNATCSRYLTNNSQAFQNDTRRVTSVPIIEELPETEENRDPTQDFSMLVNGQVSNFLQMSHKNVNINQSEERSNCALSSFIQSEEKSIKDKEEENGSVVNLSVNDEDDDFSIVNQDVDCTDHKKKDDKIVDSLKALYFNEDNVDMLSDHEPDGECINDKKEENSSEAVNSNDDGAIMGDQEQDGKIDILEECLNDMVEESNAKIIDSPEPHNSNEDGALSSDSESDEECIDDKDNESNERLDSSDASNSYDNGDQESDEECIGDKENESNERLDSSEASNSYDNGGQESDEECIDDKENELNERFDSSEASNSYDNGGQESDDECIDDKDEEDERVAASSEPKDSYQDKCNKNEEDDERVATLPELQTSYEDNDGGLLSSDQESGEECIDDNEEEDENERMEDSHPRVKPRRSNCQFEVRRSNRVRIKPLRFWAGQRPVYRPEETDKVTVRTLVDYTEGSNPHRRVIRRPQRVRAKPKALSPEPVVKPKKASLDSVLDMSIHYKHLDERGARRVKKALVNDVEQDQGFKKQPFGKYQWKESKHSPGVFTTIMEKKGNYSIGMMKLEAKAFKIPIATGDYTTYIQIIYGVLECVISKKPSIVLRSGDFIKIDSKTTYSLRNLRDEDAIVSFSVAKN